MKYHDLMKIRQEAIDTAMRAAHEKLTFAPQHWGSLIAGCECRGCKLERARLAETQTDE